MCQNCPGSMLEKKNKNKNKKQKKTEILRKNFKDSRFYGKKKDPKVCTFGLILSPCLSMKMTKIEDSSFTEKLQSWGYQICQKQGSISFPLGKNMITFCTIWTIFSKKQGKIMSLRVRNKI